MADYIRLTREQMTDIEIEMSDLVEENKELRLEIAALKEAVNRLRKERDG